MKLSDISYIGSYPDFLIESAYCDIKDRELTQEELDVVNEDSELVYNLVYDYKYGN